MNTQTMLLPYAQRQGEQTHITENYMASPPALTITDEAGVVWCLGLRVGMGPRGEYAFNVLKNGRDTGEIASRIERSGNRIRIFTAAGWKRWTGAAFV